MSEGRYFSITLQSQNPRQQISSMKTRTSNSLVFLSIRSAHGSSVNSGLS